MKNRETSVNTQSFMSIAARIKPAWAYVGLAWRPAPFMLAVFAVCMGTIQPTLFLPDGLGTLIAAWRTGAASPDIAKALWRETLVVPLYFGVIIEHMTAELDSALFAWSLPSLRRRLFQGALSVALPVACAAVVAHWRLSGTSLAIAAAGVALAAFVAGVTFRSREGLALAIAVALAIAYPTALARTVALSPPLFALLSSVGAIVLLRRSTSTRVARARRLVAKDAMLSAFRDRILGLDSDDLLPRRLTGESTLAWLRTTRYAWSGTGRGSWLRLVVLLSCMGAILAYTVNGLWWLGLMGAMAFADPKVGARGLFLYPVSRRRRATLLFLGSALQMLFFLVIGGTATGLLFWLHPWPQWPATGGHLVRIGGIGPAICIAIVWIPVAQWLQFQPPIRTMAERLAGEGLRAGVAMSYVVCLLGLIASLGTYDRTLALRPAPIGLAVIVLAILIVHTTFYLGLRRSYARKDLI